MTSAVDHLNFGAESLARGDIVTARAEAEAVLVAYPRHRDAFLVLAEACFRMGEIQNAMKALFRGEEANPDDPDFPCALGRLMLAIGQRHEALVAFKRAAAMPVVKADAVYEWAQLLLAERKFELALAAYEQTLALNPQHPTARRDWDALESFISNVQRQLIEHNRYLDSHDRIPVPYIGFTGEPHGTYRNGFRLDALGFPNKAAPTKEKARDEIRVFVLGDSSMWNGEDFSTTVPALVQANLHRHGQTNVKIYNFSIVSACSMQLLALLFFKLVDFKPDLIVAVCGAGDVYIPRTYDPRPGYPYNFFVVEELYGRFFNPERTKARETVLGYGDLLRDIAIRQAELRVEMGTSTSEAWEPGVMDKFGEFLGKLDCIAAAYDLDVAVILQPLVGTKATVTELEIETCGAKAMAYFKRQYDRYQAFLFPEGQKPRRWGECVTIYDATAHHLSV